MRIKIYQVDAFTNQLFGGNPAAVCPLENWLEDKLMQNIAAENNLAETAFFIKKGNGFHIRWFTPKAEVDLCGHATLAAAWILFNKLNFTGKTISFDSRSGILTVEKNNDWLTLNFPLDKIKPVPLTSELNSCFSGKATESFLGQADYLLVFSSQKEIENAIPNLTRIATFKSRGIIITAKGDKEDFVSRYFAPSFGIDEDPVTGSAHTTLVAYWSEKLNKNEFTAKQISERGGFLKLKRLNDRVEISGQAVSYLEGEIEVPVFPFVP